MKIGGPINTVTDPVPPPPRVRPSGDEFLCVRSAHSNDLSPVNYKRQQTGRDDECCAGHSWGRDENGKSCLGCGAQEEFYGCADIAIVSPPASVTQVHEALVWSM